MSVIERERVVTRADVLTRAADLLEEFDWCQGRMGSTVDGKMCAIGAIYEASFELCLENIASEASRAACLIHRGPPREGAVYPLSVWNDEPGRTKVEVVAELRRYAAEEDA